MRKKWSTLYGISQSTVLRTTWIWLIIVPLAAKLIAVLPDEIVLLGVPVNLKDVSLPFSWKVFYFSTIAFTGATVIYALRCPRIIKRYPDFASFERSGQTLSHLADYGQFVTDPRPVKEGRAELRDCFWQVHDREDVANLGSRIACFGLYAAGFAALTVVFVQNLIYVLGAV